MEEQEKKKRIELEQEQNMSWKNVSDPDDNGVHCKSDRNNLQFLHSRYETADHTLRDMPADDRDHRHYRMDYEKGANTGGLDHITTCMV